MATNSQVVKTITIQLNTKDSKIKIDGITKGFVEAGQAAQNFSAKASQGFDALATGANNARSATGSASATVLEAGRVVSDFNYGIRGVANNLSQLANNFVFTAKKAGGFMAGLKDIGQAFMGPLGIILAINVAIAALERWSMESEKAKKASEGFNKSLQNEIITLKIYEEALADANISLQERVGIVKGLSKLDKNLSDKLKDAAGDTEKLTKITKDYLAEKERELEIDLKRLEIQELYNKRLELTAKKTKIEEEIADKTTADFVTRNGDRAQILVDQDKIIADLSDTQLEYNNAVEDYLKLMSLTNQEEEKRGKKAKKTTKKAKAPVFDAIFDVDSLMEGYDEAKTMEFDLRRRYLESRALFFDEARIQASEANNKVLEDEIAHREKMLLNTDMGSIERIEAENELSIMRMDLKDQELEHEIMIIEARRNINMEYVSFMNGIGTALASASQRGSALATAALIIQKGAAIASIVVEAQRSIAEATSATGSANQKVADFYAPAGPLGVAPMAAQIAANSAMLAANNKRTKIGAAISIANILATTIGGNKNIKGASSSTAGGGGGGGRTFDFNLVGSTGTNQLAEAVGGQFQEPIQAYVVSNEITSQQELDLQIQTGASLGD